MDVEVVGSPDCAAWIAFAPFAAATVALHRNKGSLLLSRVERGLLKLKRKLPNTCYSLTSKRLKNSLSNFSTRFETLNDRCCFYLCAHPCTTPWFLHGDGAASPTIQRWRRSSRDSIPLTISGLWNRDPVQGRGCPDRLTQCNIAIAPNTPKSTAQYRHSIQ